MCVYVCVCVRERERERQREREREREREIASLGYTVWTGNKLPKILEKQRLNAGRGPGIIISTLMLYMGKPKLGASKGHPSDRPRWWQNYVPRHLLAGGTHLRPGLFLLEQLN